MGIESVESVGDTLIMSRLAVESIDSEIVSMSVSKDTLMCVVPNLAKLEVGTNANCKKNLNMHTMNLWLLRNGAAAATGRGSALEEGLEAELFVSHPRRSHLKMSKELISYEII